MSTDWSVWRCLIPPDSTHSLVPRLQAALVGSNLIFLVLLNAQMRTFEIQVGKLYTYMCLNHTGFSSSFQLSFVKSAE